VAGIGASAGELKALQATIEEYRSTTEELETGKEKLQSVNEDLQTVNNELRNKLEEVSRAHSDLENLMDATKIATLFLDRDLKIKRFTPGMEDLFKIGPSDRGRPISDFTHKLGYQDLVEDARTVLRNLSTLERESSSLEGGWLLVRLRPYRTMEDKIDGVVISFVDITDIKKAERIRQSYESFYTLFHANPIPTLLIRLEDNVVLNANQALLDYLQLSREDVINHTALEFNLGLDMDSAERSELTTQFLKQGVIRNFEEEITLPSGEINTVLTSIQYIYIEDADAIINTFIDISERVRAERQIRMLNIELTTAEQEERRRISQLLHDDLQQRIFAVKMQLDNLMEASNKGDLQTVKKDLEKLDGWLEEAIKLTRQLSSDLNPLSLKNEGLTEVILWLASDMQEHYGLKVEVYPEDVDIRLKHGLQELLTLAVRELLFNIVKHAETLEAQIALQSNEDGAIHLAVSDGGKGFDPGAVLSRDGSAHGLRNIYHQLQLFNCQLAIESEAGNGTRVTIDIPAEAVRKEK